MAACQKQEQHQRQEVRRPDRRGLLLDLALRQRLLQFGDVRVGDLGDPEGERPKLRQAHKVHEPWIGNLFAEA